jgi:hypothetical protein
LPGEASAPARARNRVDPRPAHSRWRQSRPLTR